MTLKSFVTSWVFTLGIAVAGSSCFAQGPQVTTQTPFQTNRDSYHFGSNIGWSVRGPWFFANFNQGGAGTVPFGNQFGNAGIRTGFATFGDRFSGSINGSIFEGSSRFSSTTTPVLTGFSGVPNSLFIGRTRPFVTGIVPVGGGLGTIPVGAGVFSIPQRTPVERFTAGERPTSPVSMNRRVVNDGPTPVGAAPLPPTRAERVAAANASAAAASAKADEYMQRARRAEEAGKGGIALIYYRTALKHASEVQAKTIHERMTALSGRR